MKKTFGAGFDRKIIYPVIVAFIAIVFRVVYFYQFKNNSPIYSLLIHDSALFNELAHRVLTNGLVGEHAFYISPLYIYFLAFVYKVLGDSFNTVRVVQFAMGVGTSLFTYYIARQLFNRTVGLVAGIVAAAYAPFLFFESNLLGTSVVTFFLTFSVFLLIRIGADKRGGLAAAFFSGLLLSLAITGRPNLILLVPVPFVYLLVSQIPMKRKTFLALAVFIGLAIPIGLTIVHNYLAERIFMPLTTHGGINFYIGNHQGASGAWEAPEGISENVSAINLEESKRFAEKATGRELTASQVSSFWYKRAFSFIAQHPVQWLALTGKKFIKFWSGYETPLNYDYYFHQRFTPLLRNPLFNLPFVISFTILGILIFFPQRRKYWLLFSVIGLTCLSVVIFFMADRYRVPVIPMFIILGAAAGLELFEMLKAGGRKKFIWFTILVLLLFMQFATTNRIVKQSDFANDCYNLSLAHLIEENYKKAIYWGERAVAEDPNLQMAHYNLGIAYLKMKDQDRALAEFRIAVRLDSTDAGAQRNLGALLLIKGEYRKALPHLEKAVRYDPQNTGGLMNLGLGYYYTGNYEKAIRVWQKLLQLDPQNEQAKKNIAAARAEMQRK